MTRASAERQNAAVASQADSRDVTGAVEVSQIVETEEFPWAVGPGDAARQGEQASKCKARHLTGDGPSVEDGESEK